MTENNNKRKISDIILVNQSKQEYRRDISYEINYDRRDKVLSKSSQICY